MRNRSLFIILILLLPQGSFCQNTGNSINWTDNLVLTWKDFRGPPDNNSTDMACTYGSMKYDFEQISENEFIFKLYVFFDPLKSWVKHGNETENLLIHEQRHFDVYEIFARKMIKKIEESKSLSGTEFSDNINKIFKDTFKDMNHFQDKYDNETDHSRKEEKQKEWTKIISDMVVEYKPWAKRELKFKPGS